jgi:biopolymer transport protein ExbB/TolQ
MSVNVDFWQLLLALCSLLSVFISLMFIGGKLLLSQFEKRLDERFGAQEKSRLESQKHWDDKFSTLEKAAANDAKEWQRIEREIMGIKADLPVQYVRRDDYIRNQTIIEAKIDGLAVRIENAILKGERNA